MSLNAEKAADDVTAAERHKHHIEQPTEHNITLLSDGDGRGRRIYSNISHLPLNVCTVGVL